MSLMSISQPASRVTLASVADEAGVSLSTISKVLNGRTDVSPRPRGAGGGACSQQHGYTRRGGRRHAQAELIELVFHELEQQLVDGDHRRASKRRRQGATA